METDVMTVNELCDYLRVHRSTIYRLLRTDAIPAFRVGSDWRFTRSRIDEWCAASKASGFPLGPFVETNKGRNGQHSR